MQPEFLQLNAKLLSGLLTITKHRSIRRPQMTKRFLHRVPYLHDLAMRNMTVEKLEHRVYRHIEIDSLIVAETVSDAEDKIALLVFRL